MAPGVYNQSLFIGPALSGVRIVGQPGAVLHPHGCHSVDILGATHGFTMSHLTIDGRDMACGQQTTDGVYINPLASHITLDTVQVLDVSNNGGRTSLGIISGASDVTLRNVTVQRTHRNFGDLEGAHCVYLESSRGDRNKVIGGIYADCGGYGIQFNDSAGTKAGGTPGDSFRGRQSSTMANAPKVAVVALC